jgi:hypothetical protein
MLQYSPYPASIDQVVSAVPEAEGIRPGDAVTYDDNRIGTVKYIFRDGVVMVLDGYTITRARIKCVNGK